MPLQASLHGTPLPLLPPARAFYSCPNWKLGRGCDFLQWADARQDLSGFVTPMAKVDALIWVSVAPHGARQEEG